MKQHFILRYYHYLFPNHFFKLYLNLSYLCLLLVTYYQILLPFLYLKKFILNRHYSFLINLILLKEFTKIKKYINLFKNFLL